MDDVRRTLLAAARAVAAAELADAFGHVSTRVSPDRFVITPPVPLGRLDRESALVEVSLTCAELPADAPKEAWIHGALYEGRPLVGAVCRAQPPHVAAFAALDRELLALNGHAAMLGEVAIHEDSRLARDAASGAAIGRAIGDADAIVLRGNGAVTCGRDLAEAVARMWLLERAAELNLRALAAGAPHPLPADERNWWRERSAELLPRIYSHLTHR